MNDEDYINLYLRSFDGIGPKTLKKAQNTCTGEKLIEYFHHTESSISFKDYKNWKQKFVENVEKRHIGILNIDDENYPQLLKNIANPPDFIFYIGNISLINQKCFAVVGSRRPTGYGVNATKDITKGLSDYGFIIVSGMALGIDSISHYSSIQNGTIAVLGCGLNYIYPSTNGILYKKIIENNGLIISELFPEILPHPALFVQRSRIIAGLSEGLLVTEAALKSGSLLACNFAFDAGRNVYAVPGDITRETSRGCNMLINRNIAKLVTTATDIIEDYSNDYISTIQKANISNNYSDLSQKIISLLKEGVSTVDLLSDSIGCDIQSIFSELTDLEIAGVIERGGSEIYLKL
ncbi:MAG: DNA-processing protein DprA [bacterium]